ncbi:MAG: hypothetical protein RBT11_01615 [Desulfobacterales bacterium]|jgi:hypothetical protein|nr:hypothetical protein [Desulfobacterales bacterium]
MNKTLNLIIALKQTGGQVLGQAVTGLGRLNAASRAYHTTLAGMNGAANQFTGMLTKMAAVLGGADLFRRAAGGATAFNDTVEKSRIGIAALVRTFNDFTDSQGRALSAQDTYTASLEIAERIQKRLQIEGLKTTATYGELLRALQEGIGPAFKAGFNPDQVVKFTSQMTQAAAALSVPMDQLGQEIRTVLSGIVDKNARVGTALGLSADKIKELSKTGGLFEYLSEKLKEFERAGEDTAKTYSGAISNLADAIQMALGKGFENSFKQTTQFLLNLRDAIVTVDEATGTFKFNDRMTAAFDQVDQAIGRVLADMGQNLQARIGDLAGAFANVAEAVIRVVGLFTRMLGVVGPFLPLIAQTVTYIVMLKVALYAVLGLPLSLFRQVTALGAGFKELGLARIITGFSGLRAAIAAAAASTGLMSVAFNAFIAAAAAQGAYNIVRLVKVLWEWRDAANGARAAQDRLTESTARMMDKYKAYADYKPPSASSLAGKSKDELTALQGELSKTRAYLIALQTDLWQKSEATTWLRRPTDEAKAAKVALLEVERKLKDVDAARKQLAAALSGKAASSGTVVNPKPPPAELTDAQKEIVAEQKRLEKELAAELIQISGDKWTVLSNQAKAHYDEQVAMAHGNVDLLAKAEKVYAARVKEINADREKEALSGVVASKSARLSAATQTALAMLEEVYRKGDVSLADYFQRRREMIDAQVRAEIDGLKALAAAETDPIKKQEINDRIFEKEQDHRRALIDLARQQADAEQQIAENRKAAEAILAGLKNRATSGTGTNLDGQFLSETGELDARHAEEIQRLRDLNAEKAKIDEAYRLQKLERDKLLFDQEQRLNAYRLQATSELAGGLSDLFQALYEAGGEKNKEFFAVAKAAAVAEAIINTYQAYTKALAQGGVWGTVQAAAALASGMAMVAKIRSQSLATGGPVLGKSPHDRADNIPIWATAGEFMQPVSTVRYYGTAVMEAMRKKLIPRDFFAGFSLPAARPAASFALAAGGSVPSSAGAFSVSVPVTISGGAEAARLAKVLPGEIEATVIRVMKREMR